MAVASGGLTDIWRGDLGDSLVAIKAFRIYPAQNLKEAKEVSEQPTVWVRSRMSFTDSLETGTGVEETIPSEHPTIPWGQHDALSTLPRLRLGAERQHYSIRILSSPRVSAVAGARAFVTVTRDSLTSFPLSRCIVVRGSEGARIPSQSRNHTW